MFLDNLNGEHLWQSNQIQQIKGEIKKENKAD